MKILFLLLSFILFSNSAFSQSKDEQAIRNMLQAQAEEWSKGNIDGYMSGYWEDDSLIFLGSKGMPEYGYTNILKNYKKAYSDTAKMGKLTLTILHIRKLSSEYYYVIGKWLLQRSIGDIGGNYTLLFQKIKNQWKIVVDHT